MRTIGSPRVGDLVEAYNPATGKTEAEPIQHVWINHDHDLVDVRVQSAGRSASKPPHSENHSLQSQKPSGGTRQAPAGKGPTRRLRATLVAGLLGLSLLGTAPRTAPVAAHATTPPPAPAETVHTTANHPWLTADAGWVPAGMLQPGELLVTLGGADGSVAQVHPVAGQADMYNLTIANDHTYAVGAGQWVVHNDDFPPGLPEPQTAKWWRNHPGVAFGGNDLPSLGSYAPSFFVRDGGGRIMIPWEVAYGLQGQSFETFKDFRRAFWIEMSKNPGIANTFRSSNRTLMEGGDAPFAPSDMGYDLRARYEINHITPIEEGGSVYDLGNMEVLAPRPHVQYHQERGGGGCP